MKLLQLLNNFMRNQNEIDQQLSTIMKHNVLYSIYFIFYNDLNI